MPPISNRIQDVFDFYKAKIRSIYPEREAQSILYLLFEELFHASRLNICTDPDRRLSESEIVLVYDAVEKLKKNIPIQYIIGKTTFCGLSFFVNDSTLIPRPETEELVLHAQQFSQNKPLNILDIGTGSGCIAISLKKQLPDSTVYGCDISQKALEIAQKNADLNGVEVHFFECDILSEFDFLLPTMLFDVIISNPPYIPESERCLMRKNVLNYEPQSALFVPDDQPLIFYESIIKLAQKKLNKNGRLFFEIHETQGSNMRTLLQNMNFKNISLEKDLFGKDRIIIAVFE